MEQQKLVPKYRDGFEWGGVFQMNPHALARMGGSP